MKPLFVALASSLMSISAWAEPQVVNPFHQPDSPVFKTSYSNISPEHLTIALDAEKNANPIAQKILYHARVMTLFNREIIRGGCWHYVNTVFNRAGFADKSRQVVHQGTYKHGPYAKADDIQAGDWLYHINYGYKNIEHSGMFIAWVNKEQKQALMLSYAGEGRREPARYKVYDLRSVYQITRAIDHTPVAVRSSQ